MFGARRFQLRIAVEDRLSPIMAFHKAHLTEHLWPRKEEEFRALAQNECLMEVVELKAPAFLDWLLGKHCEQIVGLAYVATGTELDGSTPRAEFGGIFVSEEVRGYGLAVALGIVSISNYFVQDPPAGRMIAHVHEFNDKPRRVLENHLGFKRNGEEVPPPGAAPASMKRNDRGEVVGHLFEFDRRALRSFAEWIERFSGESHGKSGQATLELRVPSMTKYREATLEALRDMGRAEAADARPNALDGRRASK